MKAFDESNQIASHQVQKQSKCCIVMCITHENVKDKDINAKESENQKKEKNI